ncbi:VWA domain-containing protein [Evansella sp. AB-rgal1]|uniref:VWA domain-containing protein n=1 Tax=Evansella sp. AB-rgal1 TaxID=3242696 RepID=UPI00359D9122
MPVPETLEEVVAYPTGAISGQRFRDDPERFLPLLDELPVLGESATEEEFETFFKKFLLLVAGDYPGPENVLRDSKISAFGDEEIEDERFHFRNQLNVQIILDVSGSMAAYIDGKQMMDIAKDSIREVTFSLPEGTNVGLRVYGHKGDSTRDSRELSCSSSELVYDIKPLVQQEFNSVLDQFRPTGWTPLALSIEEAVKDFEGLSSEENTNIIYLLSDGIETCDGDPVSAAKAAADSEIRPIINVIGFNLDPQRQKELREIAEAADGSYSDAMNEEQLLNELRTIQIMAERWDEWKRDAISDATTTLRHHRMVDIPHYMSIWYDNIFAERANFLSIRRYLLDEGKITREAANYLSDRAEERISLLRSLRKGLRAELRDEAERIYDEGIGEIEEEYNEGDE